MHSLHSNVTNNLFTDNDVGIEFFSVEVDAFYCQYNELIKEECEEHKNSESELIQLHFSNVSVFKNTFSSHLNYGIKILENSEFNRIFNNNFIKNNFLKSNREQLAQSFEWENTNSKTYWNNETVGNYWSNYDGVDSNNDSTGDTAYSINTNNFDNYPQIKPVNISLNLSNPNSKDLLDKFNDFKVNYLPVVTISSNGNIITTYISSGNEGNSQNPIFSDLLFIVVLFVTLGLVAFYVSFYKQKKLKLNKQKIESHAIFNEFNQPYKSSIEKKIQDYSNISKICLICSQAVLPDDLFCHNCGERLSKY
jgi:hypothetical protein